MASNPRKQLEAWLKTIEVKGKVFDFGGAQLPAKGRVGKWDADQYVIFDLDQPHEEAKTEHKTYSLDLNNYSEGYIQYLRSVVGDCDAAFCLEVMEYVIEPVQALKAIRLLMKEGATLYISFGFLYPEHNPIGADFLRYTQHGARQALVSAGFVPTEGTFRMLSDGGRAAYRQLWREEGMRPSMKGADRAHDASGWLIKAIAV